MKRWMVAAALGLAAAAGIVTPGTARASSSTWYQVYQSGFTGGFDQIAALSQSNIWAVGDISKAGWTVYEPFIRHFNGRSWQAITIPDSSGSTSDWVSASASNLSMPHPVPYDGLNVTAVSPSNVWVGYDASSTRSSALHWDGHQWHTVTPPNYANTYDIVPDAKGG